MNNNKKKKAKGVGLAVLTVFGLFLGFLAFFSGLWFRNVFGNVGFDSVVFTLTNSLKGADMSPVWEYLWEALLPTLLVVALLSVLLLVRFKRPLVVRIGKRMLRFFPVRRTVAAILSLVLSFGLIASAVEATGLREYVVGQLTPSTLYEDYFVDPQDVALKFPEKKQNLVFIILESIENTFMSVPAGGGLKHDLITELVKLQEGNVSFSHNEWLGGAYNTAGTTWSVGALIAMTTGAHFQLPRGIGRNDYGKHNVDFLPGATTLMDILHKEGYYQEYLLGCDANFGGLRQYFSQHGTDKVFDYYTARDEGFIPKDYFKWWGFEDKKLMDYAQSRLTALGQAEVPFALYISTMDPHRTNGYFCEDCENKFPQQYDNVISCFSKRIASFMEWMEAQPFMENTTVVLIGDHLTMDERYIRKFVSEGYVRTTYNCIVNSKVMPTATKNRLFCSMDLFPTMLAAMGCEIPGNRLGLGTNLFSQEKTLMEQFGSFEKLNSQLVRYSEYFAKNIAKRPAK